MKIDKIDVPSKDRDRYGREMTVEISNLVLDSLCKNCIVMIADYVKMKGIQPARVDWVWFLMKLSEAVYGEEYVDVFL